MGTRGKTWKNNVPCTECGKPWSTREFNKWGRQCKVCIYTLGKSRLDPEVNKAYQRKYHQNLKDAFFDMYGGTCECCDEGNPKFITAEHKDGNTVLVRNQSEYRRAVKEADSTKWGT